MPEFIDFGSAIEDFHRARARAELKEILARFTGESTNLLSYDEVRQKLKLKGSAEVGLRDIPLDAIVGSVGRYSDFTRDFLPRGEVNSERWARVKLAATDLTGLPPIEVYQIGEAYFVKDGNHRVSVAQEIGAKYIQAYVTEIRTRVPLTPDISPDELILKAEYADFLEKTHLDDLRPEANLSVTVPGQFPILEEHIDVHRYFMGLDQKRDIPYEEAVTHWYDTVYLPVVQLIRERGILGSFPNRTETDLYLWITEHRAAIEKELGWTVPTEAAVTDLADTYGANPQPVLYRLGEKIIKSLTNNKLEPGPPPGQWRKNRTASQSDEHLFGEILVPINGTSGGWEALTQALEVAQHEGAFLHGLHVVPDETDMNREESLEVQAEFNRRCLEAGIPGELVLAAGEVPKLICNRSRWTDLIITRLTFPPAPQPLARLSSGFRELIQSCPRPLLAVPQASVPIRKALLAYDGSPKAQEALFISAYFAGRWQIPLVVVSVVDNKNVTDVTLKHAQDYLETLNVPATYIQEYGSPAEQILEVSKIEEVNLMVMGGYGYSPILEVMLGSVVDQVLRATHIPMLVSR